MNLSSTRTRFEPFKGLSKIRTRPEVIFAVIILVSLVAFEMFNYSTTDYALRDLLGNLQFAGIHWATILAFAFCAIDFAGIARLFTPDSGQSEAKEVWYLFGAWLLAATMNATLTWWGVSMAIVNHSVASTAVLDAKTLTQVVPIFVAIMVWVIRVMIIGSLSVAIDRLSNPGGQRSPARQEYRPSIPQRPMAPSPSLTAAPAPSPRQVPVQHVMRREVPTSARPEPSYHSVSMSPRPMPRPQPGDMHAESARM